MSIWGFIQRGVMAFCERKKAGRKEGRVAAWDDGDHQAKERTALSCWTCCIARSIRAVRAERSEVFLLARLQRDFVCCRKFYLKTAYFNFVFCNSCQKIKHLLSQYKHLTITLHYTAPCPPQPQRAAATMTDCSRRRTQSLAMPQKKTSLPSNL